MQGDDSLASIISNFWTKIKELTTSKKIEEVIEKKEDVDPSTIINSFEKIIRYFIIDELRSVFGDKWLKQGVPKEIRTNWLERKSDDEKAGKIPENNLINYADFSDYKVIILHNWVKIFLKFFNDKEQTRVRFDDLNNFRKAAMHSRGISDDDIGHCKVTIKWIKNKIASVGKGWAEKMITFKRIEEKDKGYKFGCALSEKIGDMLGYIKILKIIEIMQSRIGMPINDENAYERYIEAFDDLLDDVGANVVLQRKEEFTEGDYRKEKEKFEKNARNEGSLAWILKIASIEKDFPTFECSDEFLGEMFRAIHVFYGTTKGNQK